MSKNRAKRYFGMTVVQLLVLGCLALVACVTLAGGGVIVNGVIGGDGFSLLPSPMPTSTPAPTSTPYLTETPTLVPTATLIPYEELVPSGWDQYTTTTLELWVPPQFKPVDVEKELQATIKFYRDQGYDDLAQQLEDNPPAYVFWFRDTKPSANSLYTAGITLEPVLVTGTSLDEFLDQRYANGPQEYHVVNRQEFQVGNYEARRVLLEGNLNTVYVSIAQYVIFDGVNAWVINCTAHINDFYTLLPEFDKVAHTFRLIGQ